MANDIFANIAAGGIGGRMDELCQVTPKEHDEIICKLEDTAEEALKTEPKMNSREELYEELENMRREYAPFLEDYAPKLKSKRTRIDIKEFILDGKSKITIPHYEGPVGYAKKTYERIYS